MNYRDNILFGELQSHLAQCRHIFHEDEFTVISAVMGLVYERDKTDVQS